MVQQSNTLADRKIDEIQTILHFDPTTTPIVQPSLPIWITINDTHITSKLKSTIRNTVNDKHFKKAFTKNHLVTTDFNMIK